jgi:hypothetical protein
MYSEAVDVRYLEGYRVEVTFKSGEKGIADLSEFAARGRVFSQFLDHEYFRQVIVNKELGVLTWPDGVDIAPETIYSMATGKPLPEWMEPDEKTVRS